MRLDGLRIVVIGEEVDARRVVSRTLAGAGAIVTTAANVPEALRAIERVQPRLLGAQLTKDSSGFGSFIVIPVL